MTSDTIDADCPPVPDADQDGFATDLSTLKPGDRVLIRSGYGYATYEVGVVAKLTATQVVVRKGGRDVRFSKARDFRVTGGSSYRDVRIVAARESFLRDYREQVAREVFRAVASLSGKEIVKRLGWDRVKELKALFESTDRD